MGLFHAKDNWFVSRDKPTGTVIIEHKDPKQSYLNDRRVELEADIWASIVAFVSAGGDDCATFEKARTLHDNPKGLEQIR